MTLSRGGRRQSAGRAPRRGSLGRSGNLKGHVAFNLGTEAVDFGLEPRERVLEMALQSADSGGRDLLATEAVLVGVPCARVEHDPLTNPGADLAIAGTRTDHLRQHRTLQPRRRDGSLRPLQFDDQGVIEPDW